MSFFKSSKYEIFILLLLSVIDYPNFKRWKGCNACVELAGFSEGINKPTWFQEEEITLSSFEKHTLQLLNPSSRKANIALLFMADNEFSLVSLYEHTKILEYFNLRDRVKWSLLGSSTPLGICLLWLLAMTERETLPTQITHLVLLMYKWKETSFFTVNEFLLSF